jgi:hypothetical protein
MVGISAFVLQYAASGALEMPLLYKGVAGVPALDTLLCGTALLHWYAFDRSPQGEHCAFLALAIVKFPYPSAKYELCPPCRPRLSYLLSIHFQFGISVFSTESWFSFTCITVCSRPQSTQRATGPTALQLCAGMFMAVLTAVAGPATEVVLINKLGLYHYSHATQAGIPTWIPSVYFCGSPAVGNLGRKVKAVLERNQTADAS